MSCIGVIMNLRSDTFVSGVHIRSAAVTTEGVQKYDPATPISQGLQ